MSKLSVLMSVYYNEKPDNLKISLESIRCQTLKEFEFLLVIDGPIASQLLQVIEDESPKFKDRGVNFKIIKLQNNHGLTGALNIGIAKIKTKYVARMDSDDFSYPNRLERQLNFLENHKDIALIGTDIQEFRDKPQNISSVKKMPKSFDSIKKYSKIRNPFCHPTVCFQKKIIEELGGYENYPLFEDYQLWVKVIRGGYKCVNLSEQLVEMRIDDGIYGRRGGIGYIKKNFKFRLYLLKTGYITVYYFIYGVCVVTIASSIPTFIRKQIYLNFLRNSRKRNR